MSYAYSTRSHWKQYAFETRRRYVLNVLYSARIRATSLKVYSNLKTRKASATFQSWRYLNKNKRFNKECPTKRLSLGLLRFSIRRKTLWKAKSDNSLENSDKKSPNRKKLSSKNFNKLTKIHKRKSKPCYKQKKLLSKNSLIGKSTHTSC